MIDVPISSDFVTPVYAFSRLFVFWVELKEVSSAQIKTADDEKVSSTNQLVWSASVRFSFHDLNGKWVAPQTLYEEQVVTVEPSSPPFNEASGYELLNPGNRYWQKVNAIRVGPENAQRVKAKLREFRRQIAGRALTQ